MWGHTPRSALITSPIRKDCMDLVGRYARIA